MFRFSVTNISASAVIATLETCDLRFRTYKKKVKILNLLHHDTKSLKYVLIRY